MPECHSCDDNALDAPGSLRQRSSKLERVLCADDDLDVQAAIEIALRELGGLTVISCNDGSEVMKRACCSTPDLILLDTKMPILDGPSTLTALKQNPATRTFPVAFITADQSIVSSWQQNFPDLVGVLAKPFDPLTLADHVREIYADAFKS